MFTLTLGYKKSIFIGLDKGTHKFKALYGMSAFIVDIVNGHIHRINYEQVRNKLSKIKVAKADEAQAYIYVVSKTAISIIVFLTVLLAGYVRCIEGNLNGQRSVVSLKRPQAGEGETRYSLELEYGDRHENISIAVEERKYGKEEAEKLFSNQYFTMIDKFLGKNESLEKITDRVNMIHELGDNISVDWEIEEPDYIDYSGNINWNEIGEYKETTVFATMSLGEYSKSYELRLCLNPQEKSKRQQVFEKIDELKSKPSNEEEINLEDVIEEYDVKFLTRKQRGSYLYLPAAVIFGIVIYIIKERDTDKILDKRRQQLEADYAAIISKLTILQSSGMTVLGAWDKIIEDYEKSVNKSGLQDIEGDSNKAKKSKKLKRHKRRNKEKSSAKRYAYEEMKYARQNMRAGYSQSAAYLEFGRRCGTHSYIKFANLLEQNIKKGTKGLKEILRAEVNEAFEERKALARKKGDEAGTKLLLPMGIMLVISIVIIIIPALMGFNI